MWMFLANWDKKNNGNIFSQQNSDTLQQLNLMMFKNFTVKFLINLAKLAIACA